MSIDYTALLAQQVAAAKNEIAKSVFLYASTRAIAAQRAVTHPLPPEHQQGILTHATYTTLDVDALLNDPTFKKHLTKSFIDHLKEALQSLCTETYLTYAIKDKQQFEQDLLARILLIDTIPQIFNDDSERTAAIAHHRKNKFYFILAVGTLLSPLLFTGPLFTVAAAVFCGYQLNQSMEARGVSAGTRRANGLLMTSVFCAIVLWFVLPESPGYSWATDLIETADDDLGVGRSQYVRSTFASIIGSIASLFAGFTLAEACTPSSLLNFKRDGYQLVNLKQSASTSTRTATL